MKPQDIKEKRLKHGLTQEQLARRLGVTVGTVNRWESGATEPSPLAKAKLREDWENYVAEVATSRFSGSVDSRGERDAD